jgi:hypothetical protein
MAKGLHVWDLGTCCTPGVTACGLWYPMLGGLGTTTGVYDPQYQIGNEVLWQDLGSPSPGDFTSIYGNGTCAEYLGKIPLSTYAVWNGHSIMPNWFNTWPPDANKYTSCDCGGGIPGAPPQTYDMHAYECLCPQAGGAPAFPPSQGGPNGCCGHPHGHIFVMGDSNSAASTLGNHIPLNDSFYTTKLNSPNIGDTFTMTLTPSQLAIYGPPCIPCFRYIGTVPAYGPLNATTGASTFNNPNISFMGVTQSLSWIITQTSNINLVNDCNCIPDVGIDPNMTVLQPPPGTIHMFSHCIDCDLAPLSIMNPDCCGFNSYKSWMFLGVYSATPWPPTFPPAYSTCSNLSRQMNQLFYTMVGSPAVGEHIWANAIPASFGIGNIGPWCLRYDGPKSCVIDPTPQAHDWVDGHRWDHVACTAEYYYRDTTFSTFWDLTPTCNTCCCEPTPGNVRVDPNWVHVADPPVITHIPPGGLSIDPVLTPLPGPCPPQDSTSPYYMNAPEFCNECLPGGYYQMHPDCQCCDIDLNPLSPYVVQDKTIMIINNNLDRAINEAKIRGLIDENVPSSRVMKELEAAVLAIPKHYHENNDELIEEEGPIAKMKKKKFPEPPKWLRCKGCGGGFGVCVFGGCFSGGKWEWPI